MQRSFQLGDRQQQRQYQNLNSRQFQQTQSQQSTSRNQWFGDNSNRQQYVPRNFDDGRAPGCDNRERGNAPPRE